MSEPPTDAEPESVPTDSTGQPFRQEVGAQVILPARTFEHDGHDWVVLDGGRSLTGTGHLAPAHMRMIQFAHADAPDKPLREITAAPRPVDQLHDEELIVLLERAREVPVYAPPGEPGTDDRRPRGGSQRGRDHRDSRRRQ